MSEGLNRVQLIGNLGADPELRMTQNGQAMLKLRLATTEVWFDKQQNKHERVEWHRVTLWGKRAEGLSKLLCKGSRVYIDGRIQTSSYEKDGKKQFSTDIIADQLLFCGGKQPERSAGAGSDMAFSSPSSSFNGAFSAPPPISAVGANDDIPF